jgi:phosphomethylpyrimidine synthase
MMKLALAPSKARALRDSSRPSDTALCTMCGEYCAMKKVKGVMQPKS